MEDHETDTHDSKYTLFPVRQKDGTMYYYASDYSEELGNSVYKGYRCTLKNTEIKEEELKRRRFNKEEINIFATAPVAIKFYPQDQSPSPYQFYASQIAIVPIQGCNALIMDFIDGFHIFPDIRDNPQIRLLTFAQAADIAWQLVLGLNHYHYNNTSGQAIVHGDVKGTNIKIRMKEIDVNGIKKHKYDVFYLDPDYAKPIGPHAQHKQGTSEHLALEVLDGLYSEESDFFALSPVLLSLFGAYNPFSRIFEFRDRHPDMGQAELVRQLRAIDFCSTGLFGHFSTKPTLLVCQLVEQFTLQMGAKLKNNRPSSNAILEFFTSLRQLSLLNDLKQDTTPYLLRLCIATQDMNWFRKESLRTLFIELEEHLQNRLIAIMNYQQTAALYKVLKEHKSEPALLNRLRGKIAEHLMEQSYSLEEPSCLSSIFSSPVGPKDLQWFLNCYQQNNHSEFYATKNKKIRDKLIHCSDKKISDSVSIIADGLHRIIETATPSIN